MTALNNSLIEDTKLKYYRYELQNRTPAKNLLSRLPSDLFQEVSRFLGAQGIHDLARTSKPIRDKICKFTDKAIFPRLTPDDFPPKLSLNKDVFHRDVLEFFENTKFKKILPGLILALPFLQMARVDIKEEITPNFPTLTLPRFDYFEKANAPIIFGLQPTNKPYIAFLTRYYHPKSSYFEDRIDMLYEPKAYSYLPEPGIRFLYYRKSIPNYSPVVRTNLDTTRPLEPLFEQFNSTIWMTPELLTGLANRITQLSKSQLIPSDILKYPVKRFMLSFVHRSNFYNETRIKNCEEEKSRGTNP